MSNSTKLGKESLARVTTVRLGSLATQGDFDNVKVTRLGGE